MPKSILTLSEESIRTLQAVLDRERRSPVNPLGRQAAQEDGQSPEVYVSKAPVGGIAALSGITPGTAICDIYRLLLGDSSDTLEQVDLQKNVYNLGSSGISTGAWMLIARDKFGAWYVTGIIVEDQGDTYTGTGTDGDSSSSLLTVEAVDGVPSYSDVHTLRFDEADGFVLSNPSPGVVRVDLVLPSSPETSGTGTGTSGSLCTPITVQETDILCEEGRLNLYRRVVTIDTIVNGCLTKVLGEWEFVRFLTCCETDSCVDTGTGTSTSADTGTGTSTDDLLWYCISPPNDTGTGTLGGDTGTGTAIGNARCYQLTVAEKNTLVTGGWVLHGIGRATYSDCQASCTAVTCDPNVNHGCGQQGWDWIGGQWIISTLPGSPNCTCGTTNYPPVSGSEFEGQHTTTYCCP